MVTTTSVFGEKVGDTEDDGDGDPVVLDDLVCLDLVCFLEDLEDLEAVGEEVVTISVQVCLVCLGLCDLVEAVLLASYKTVMVSVAVSIYDGTYSTTLVVGTISTIVVRSISSVEEQSSVMIWVSVFVFTSCSSASWVLMETG